MAAVRAGGRVRAGHRVHGPGSLAQSALVFKRAGLRKRPVEAPATDTSTGRLRNPARLHSFYFAISDSVLSKNSTHFGRFAARPSRLVRSYSIEQYPLKPCRFSSTSIPFA